LVLAQTQFRAYGAETGEMPENRKHDFWLTSGVTNAIPLVKTSSLAGAKRCI
jgi:hypothetical protein